MNRNPLPPMVLTEIRRNLGTNAHFTSKTVEMLLVHIDTIESELQETKDRLMLQRVSHLLESSVTNASETARAMRQLIRSS